MRRFIRELKRRSVFKVATGYAVVAWVVMQVADVMFPALNLRPWTITLVAALLIIGFPIALLLAWAYEITPAGVTRDTSVDEPDVSASAPPSPGKNGPSIAVLPFADMSAGHDQGYFGDGLTEELLSALARIPGLRVPSRTSCFAFKGKDLDVTVVADRLRVTHVLEGSVRKSGDRLRITAKLVETASDSHLWSDTYDRALEDIFVIQDEIARKIVEALKLQLRSLPAADPTTQDARAYDLYLKGLSFYHRLDPKSIRYSIGVFRHATDLDPEFAKAWAGLSMAHAAMTVYYSGGDTDLRASDEASRRAVDLAPRLAEAHTARAVSFSAQERFDEAVVAFGRAVELNPRSFETWYHYARTAVHQGALRRALELFEKAADVDPQDYQGPLLAAPIYRSLGDEQKAVAAECRGVELAERHLESYPDNARAYFLSVAALYSLGEKKKAFDWAEKAMAIDPANPGTRYNLACFYAQVGQLDRALDYLEGSVASRSWAENDPELEPIRDHPRFRAYLESMTK